MQGRWSLSQKPEIKLPGLNFGHAVRKDSGGWCGEVRVRWQQWQGRGFVKREGGGGFGPKS